MPEPTMSRVLLALLLLGCGSSDDPTPATEPAPRAEDHAAEAPAGATPEPSGPTAYQLVGVDPQHVLFLDTAAPRWQVQRFGVGALATPQRPLEAAAFLGCGARAVARTRSQLTIFDRRGEGTAFFGIPSLRGALGQQLDAMMADKEREYGVAPPVLEVISPGPLRRDARGRLSLVTRVSLGAFNGELEGCYEEPDALRVELDLEEHEGEPCETPATTPIDLSYGAEVRSGWRCVRHPTDASDELPEVPWIEGGLAAVAGAIPFDPARCVDGEPPDAPLARLDACLTPGELSVCRWGDDPILFTTIVGDSPMGCGAPELYLVRGGQLLGRTGAHAQAFTVGAGPDELLLLGGAEGWHVVGRGGRHAALGVSRPDVVLGPSP